MAPGVDPNIWLSERPELRDEVNRQPQKMRLEDEVQWDADFHEVGEAVATGEQLTITAGDFV